MNATLLVLAGLAGLLFPAGVALWAGGASGGVKGASRSAAYILAAVALGLVGYVAVGFALSFGGAGGLYPALGELPALRSFWTPLATWQGPGWALAGSAGYFAAVGDDAGAYALFFFQAVLASAALSLLAAVFSAWLRPQPFALLVMLFGWLLYPLTVAWTWGGGWLWNLGATRDLGHGLVDAGGGVILLAVGAAALGGGIARLWASRAPAPVAPEAPEEAAAPDDAPPSEPAPQAGPALAAAEPTVPAVVHDTEALPGTALAGVAAMSAGWLALLAGLAVMTGTSPALPLVNALASAAAGGTVALGYMGFTTSRLNGAMGGRGLLAGLFAAGVSGPFVSTPAAMLIGAVAGLAVCWATYLAARWRLDDGADGVAVCGVSGLWGLLALGIFAHGRAGQGWHGVGLQSYLGAAGQGVTGLWPAPGFTADPPQLAAQLAGVAAVLLWVLLSVALLLVVAGARPEPGNPSR